MLLAIIVLLAIFLDQLSKYLILKILIPQQSLPLIKNFFHLSLVHNTGIAFGLFKNQTVFFILVSVITIIVIIFTLLKQNSHKITPKIEQVGLSLILGGAIGNLIDRIRLGYVIDFLDFRIWPVFNFADSFITIGVTLILLRCILSFSK